MKVEGEREVKVEGEREVCGDGIDELPARIAPTALGIESFPLLRGQNIYKLKCNSDLPRN